MNRNVSTDNTDPASQEAPNSTIYLSAISISLASNSRKTIESITVYKTKVALRKVEKRLHANESHREEFTQPVALDLSDHIVISANCSIPDRKRVDVAINVDLGDDKYMRNEGDTQLYRIKDRNIEVTIITHRQLPSLAVATQPQFRLLVIGNSGVGKSTLIHKVFGIEDVDTCTADIEREFTSPKIKSFIVHASLGFETGDERSMDIMKEFVAKRKAMPEVRDQLHAVWLCLEIPYAGGRLLETGVERFLQSRKEILGDIRLVAVLTKVDLLDGQLELDLPEDEILEDFKSKFLQEHCIKPLHATAGNDITHTIVSMQDDYSESLFDLLKVTNDGMEEYLAAESPPNRAATPALYNDIKEKIELSIGLGKKKYKKTLLNSVFRVHSLNDCLEMIREDIINTWNLNDPDKRLKDDKMIGDLGIHNRGDEANRASKTQSLTGPGGVFGSLLRKKDAKILMTYLVDLIFVMKIICLLASDDKVTSQMVDLALTAYEGSKETVHQTVDGFDMNVAILPGGCDLLWKNTETLIWRYSITGHEIEKLRNKVGQAPLIDPVSSASQPVA